MPRFSRAYPRIRPLLLVELRSSALARNYTTLDHSFCSILGPTFPNRFFLHAAQTDRLINALLPTNLPTIWDNLLAAGVSARYYWSNIPILFFWGNKYFLNGITTPFPNIGSFVSDAQNGTLPAVSFVMARDTTANLR